MNKIIMFHNSLIINGKKYSKIFCDIPKNPYLCVLKLYIMAGKLDSIEALKRVQNKLGTTYSFPNWNYNGMHEKVNCHCNLHDHTYTPTPSNILKGKGYCSVCVKIEKDKES